MININGFFEEEMINQNYISVQDRYIKILGMNPALSVQEKVYLQLGDLNYLYLGDFNSAIKYYLKVLELSSTINWKIQAYEKIGEIYFNVLILIKEMVCFKMSIF